MEKKTYASCSNPELQCRNELVVEDVVVSGVTNSSTDDTDSQSESSDGGNEIVRTDDGRDNRGGNDDSTNTETGNDENSINGVQVVQSGCCKSSASRSHHYAGTDHQSSVVTAQDR